MTWSGRYRIVGHLNLKSDEFLKNARVISFAVLGNCTVSLGSECQILESVHP